jgi:hypothetical protein
LPDDLKGRIENEEPVSTSSLRFDKVSSMKNSCPAFGGERAAGDEGAPEDPRELAAAAKTP